MRFAVFDPSWHSLYILPFWQCPWRFASLYCITCKGMPEVSHYKIFCVYQDCSRVCGWLFMGCIEPCRQWTNAIHVGHSKCCSGPHVLVDHHLHLLVSPSWVVWFCSSVTYPDSGCLKQHVPKEHLLYQTSLVQDTLHFLHLFDLENKTRYVFGM